jgi:hypothetical protein
LIIKLPKNHERKEFHFLYPSAAKISGHLRISAELSGFMLCLYAMKIPGRGILCPGIGISSGQRLSNNRLKARGAAKFHLSVIVVCFTDFSIKAFFPQGFAGCISQQKAAYDEEKNLQQGKPVCKIIQDLLISCYGKQDSGKKAPGYPDKPYCSFPVELFE